MAAMGGGMMESAFGPDTSNVLSKFTIRATIVFFVLSFGLYLGYVRVRGHGSNGHGALPNVSASPALPSMPAGLPPSTGNQPAVSVPPAAPGAASTTTPGSSKGKTP